MARKYKTDKSQIAIIEKDLSYKLIGLFIKVSQQYGHLYKEDLYHNALKELLELEKISFKSKPLIRIYSQQTGKPLSTYIPDYLVNSCIIVELKAQPFLNQESINQLNQYLKASEYELGFLVNFGEPKANIIRRIYTNDLKKWYKIKNL